jgi:outer membrane receptor protein involved in Fe transport
MLLLDDRQKALGNQLEGLFSLTTGSVEHSLMAGFEARRLTDVFTLDAALLPTIDLYNPVETASEPLFMIPGQSTAADARTINLGLYFVDQLTFSEKFQLFVGGRWDGMDYKDQVTATERAANEFSPMLGAVYSPVKDWSVYANYGRAFAPPSSRVVGEREPEKSRQIEVGVKKSLASQNGLISFAVYDLERENIGIPDANGFTQQAGTQRSRGVEIEMAVEACSGWLTNASYAFNDSELTQFSEMVFTGRQPPFVVFDRTGNQAPFAPRHILNLWTMKELPGGFRIGGGTRYLSSQFIAPDNRYAIDGYVTFDAMVSYRQSNWLFKLNFKNFTGQEFETRGFGNSSVIPADPFTVYASIELSLGS